MNHRTATWILCVAGGPVAVMGADGFLSSLSMLFGPFGAYIVMGVAVGVAVATVAAVRSH